KASVEISVRPTFTNVDCPNPLKMSAMPQTPKLTIKIPITTPMPALPSQFDEAFRIPRSMCPTCWQEGTGLGLCEFRKKGVTGLITHHKVAVAPPHPRTRGLFEAVNGQGMAKVPIWPRLLRSASEAAQLSG